jgi:restriction system protein
MGIWEYKTLERRCDSATAGYIANAFDLDARHKTCVIDEGRVGKIIGAMSCCCDFCKSRMMLIDKSEYTYDLLSPNHHDITLMCNNCGWWLSVKIGERFEDRFFLAPNPDAPTFDEALEEATPMGVASFKPVGLSSSHLKTLDLARIDNPIEEVEDYLRVRYDERFDVHPRVFEEIVASVFKNAGYEVEVTNYANDGGIDVILNGGRDSQIGVQVKRYKNSIKVHQIREFLGALVVNGFVRGVFVTTSRYDKGAHRVVEEASAKGYFIDLVDNNSFFSALKIRHVDYYKGYEDWDERNPRRCYAHIGDILGCLIGA